MILPHLAAVYLAWRRKPLLAGMCAGLAFALNIKGLAVLLVCLVFAPAAWFWILAGFLIPNGILLGWLTSQHAFPAYIKKVFGDGVFCMRARRRVIRRLKALWYACGIGLGSMSR